MDATWMLSVAEAPLSSTVSVKLVSVTTLLRGQWIVGTMTSRRRSDCAAAAAVKTRNVTRSAQHDVTTEMSDPQRPGALRKLLGMLMKF